MNLRAMLRPMSREELYALLANRSVVTSGIDSVDLPEPTDQADATVEDDEEANPADDSDD